MIRKVVGDLIFAVVCVMVLYGFFWVYFKIDDYLCGEYYTSCTIAYPDTLLCPWAPIAIMMLLSLLLVVAFIRVGRRLDNGDLQGSC
jgi:ABC-type branched-subunit amino acid transport system permease subunit